MNAATDKLNLVLGVYPSAGESAVFSTEVQYVFHIKSAPELNSPEDASRTSTIVCTFTEDQRITCITANDKAIGYATDAAGLISRRGSFRVFAGRRDDPAYFNESGFKDVVSLYQSAASEFSKHSSGCPILNGAQSTAILSRIFKTNEGVDDPKNTYAGKSILALVVEIDKAALNAKGDLLSVFATTNAAVK
jgi:hypothetical protein